MKKLLQFSFVAFLASVSQSFAQSKPIEILCLGDSLTEGYQLSKEEAWPALVEKELQKKGYTVKLINAGISGSTTASGPSRLKWHLKGKKPHAPILILALGANDGLRGLPIDSAKINLATTIDLAKASGITVLLAGMKIPPNYGARYAQDFQNMFPALAKEKSISYLPFLLEGVGGEASLNLADGIHPNARGYEIIAKTVLERLEPILKGLKP